ncbi:MAG: hypothetical protein R3255_06490 [Candidatus Lokiarchaeia archaeon]|nr:hypothetical protein [Candidatus Lokiarchaeia archaeon]
MTNLIEKSLLLGFGIFTLTIFSSIVVPFLGTIAEFNQNGRNDLESYLYFINEIDQGINYVIENPNKVYLKNVNYPINLNTSFYTTIAKFEFFIEDQLCIKIKEYNESFINQNFQQIIPETYLLNISYRFTLINVNFNNLY